MKRRELIRHLERFGCALADEGSKHSKFVNLADPRRVTTVQDVDWQSLMRLDGDELETHYRHVIESFGKAKGMFGSVLVHLGKPSGREQNTLIRIDAR